MRDLAQQVTALRPALLNGDATVGELAWVWAKDFDALNPFWRHRLQFAGGRLAATAIIWPDDATQIAEFEPVGTHRGFRRQQGQGGHAMSQTRHVPNMSPWRSFLRGFAADKI